MYDRLRRRLPLLVALLGTVASLLAAPGATAATDPSLQASCYFEEQIVTTPGLSSTGGDYSYTSVEPGLLVCTGTVAGQVITGPGWFTDAGTGSGDCAHATGYSRIQGAVPVASGEEVGVAGFVYLERVGATGELHGFVGGAFYTGTYAAHPSDSETRCSDPPAPSSRATVRGQVAVVAADEAVTPPSPHSVTAKAKGGSVEISWEAADVEGRPRIEGFHVYRGDVRVATVAADVRSIVDADVVAGTHTYEVAATGTPFESQHAPPVTAVVRRAGRPHAD